MTNKAVPLNYYTPENAMPGDEFILLVAEMRASQRRWPMHPVQGSIEAMALESKVDEAIATGITLGVRRPPISETDGPVPSIGAKRRDPDT